MDTTPLIQNLTAESIRHDRPRVKFKYRGYCGQRFYDTGRGGVYCNRYNVMLRGLQRVIKVGNSLAVVLPAEMARALEIQRGQAVGLSVTDSTFIIIKLIPEYDVQKMRLNLPDIES